MPLTEPTASIREYASAPANHTPTGPSEDSPGAAVALQLSNRIWWKALVAGAVADSFVWQLGPGLSYTAYALTVVAAAGSVLHFRFGIVPRSSRRLLQLACVFAGLLSFRDSALLALLNFIVCACSIMLALAVSSRAPINSFTHARIRDYLQSLSHGSVSSVFGTVPFLARWAKTQDFAQRPGVLNALRPAAIAIVVAISFGAMLASGDPVFRNGINWMLDWNAGTLAEHIGFTALFAWPVMGVLSGNPAMPGEKALSTSAYNSTWSLQSTDVISALTALNVVFLGFVTLQARALFGGQQYVLATTGLSLADYARSGFFTLIVTAGLVLSLLLAMNALLDNELGLSSSRAMRLLCVVALAQVGVVLASSATRMTIYMNEFGASIERFYCLVIIGWLALVMGWFALTLLRNRPARFAFGSLALACATLFSLNVANPDAIVARNHLARAERGARYDREFLVNDLSADAVPVIVHALQRENACHRSDLCSMVPALQSRWATPTNANPLGSWTLGQWDARRVVRSFATPAP